ncbi:MAG: hypothetical protein P4N60_23530, partial [Verrucomicrobiae bacterium]|nr:hypothetical protein [Verrucomicrobiae bacterium]
NLLDAPPFTQCQNRMKHFLWNHKVTTLTAPPQLFQTFLPITNVEEAEKALIVEGRAVKSNHALGRRSQASHSLQEIENHGMINMFPSLLFSRKHGLTNSKQHDFK